jgi:hypothetical protein
MSSRRLPSLVAVTDWPFFSISIEGLHHARISYHLPKAGSQVPSAIVDIYHKKSTSLGSFLSTNKLLRRAGPSWPSSNATAEKNFSKPTVDEKGRCKDSHAGLNRTQTKNSMNLQIPLDSRSKGVVGGTSAKRDEKTRRSTVFLEPPLTRAEDRCMTRRAGDYLACGNLNGFFQDLFPREAPSRTASRLNRVLVIFAESPLFHDHEECALPVVRACDVLGRR